MFISKREREIIFVICLLVWFSEETLVIAQHTKTVQWQFREKERKRINYPTVKYSVQNLHVNGSVQKVAQARARFSRPNSKARRSIGRSRTPPRQRSQSRRSITRYRLVERLSATFTRVTLQHGQIIRATSDDDGDVFDPPIPRFSCDPFVSNAFRCLWERRPTRTARAHRSQWIRRTSSPSPVRVSCSCVLRTHRVQ